jgi:transposase
MSRFPTAGHLVSWPGHDESAGKRRSTRQRNRVPWLKTTLVPCAGAASRKANYLRAQFQRLHQRRGRNKAIRALVASILTPAYHRLRATLYQDLGPNHFHRASPQTQAIRLARRIANVGFTGTLCRSQYDFCSDLGR